MCLFWDPQVPQQTSKNRSLQSSIHRGYNSDFHCCGHLRWLLDLCCVWTLGNVSNLGRIIFFSGVCVCVCVTCCIRSNFLLNSLYFILSKQYQMYVCVFVSQFCVRDSFFQTNCSIHVQVFGQLPICSIPSREWFQRGLHKNGVGSLTPQKSNELIPRLSIF